MWQASLSSGAGELELVLDQQTFLPGEIVSGRLMLQLDEPTESDRLVVGLHATHHGRTRYRVERQLAGRGIYYGGSYDFRLELPVAVPEGLTWRVYAALDGAQTLFDITVGNG